MTQLIANIRLPWLLLTLFVFGGLVKLGVWQSQRAEYKEQRLAHIEKLSQQQPLSLQQVLNYQDTTINDLPVNIDGEFAKKAVFLLDNQPNEGQLGYRVYQVLDTEYGSVLVNLGWVLGSINRNELPSVAAIQGRHRINGHIRIVEKGIMLMEQQFDKNQWPLRVQQIELDKFSTLIGKELLPFVVYLDTKELLGYKKNWQPIVMPPEKHRGYAFQWFSLAVAWLMLMVWALLKASHKKGTT